MNDKEIEKFFCNMVKNDTQVSAGIAAICTLLKFLKHDKSDTVQELVTKLKKAVDVMLKTDCPITAVVSGSELFLRFITLATLDYSTFADCKKIMLHRGEVFLNKLKEARGKIAKLASSFIVDGSTVLTHSKSRVVLETFKEAAKENKRFKVYVTMSTPDNSGEQMADDLKDLNIPCTVIIDPAIGYIMEQVDMVMVGAEGVVESGGVINKVGSYTMALCARLMKKPFYVLTESFKFSRLYPLNQRDLPNEFKYKYSMLSKDLEKLHPLVDYTPPAYISLLFTDLGILTPSAVSDELIKLYL
ncbi:translation initiation factor eIF-2B subunit alpha isoform X2 [Cimex lectularius]|nr:translation initiation factor eIF-2B subunit alpha isoform X2 [Cimex lectularius]